MSGLGSRAVVRLWCALRRYTAPAFVGSSGAITRSEWAQGVWEQAARLIGAGFAPGDSLAISAGPTTPERLSRALSAWLAGGAALQGLGVEAWRAIPPGAPRAPDRELAERALFHRGAALLRASAGDPSALALFSAEAIELGLLAAAEAFAWLPGERVSIGPVYESYAGFAIAWSALIAGATIVLGGEANAVARDRALWRGAEARAYWGSAECGLTHVDRSARAPAGSVGRPIAGVTTRLDRARLGRAGELWVRADSCASGYLGAGPRARVDGWWRTGQRGFLSSGAFVPHSEDES